MTSTEAGGGGPTTDDARARAHIRAVQRRARRMETRGRAARVVWHAWGEGPAVVLLHGGAGSWTHWIRTVPALWARHRVVAADLPGLGDSAAPPEPYSAESLGEILADGIDQVVPRGEGFDLIGFSFGGILAPQVAMRQAHRVRSLGIVGAPPFGLGASGPANQIVAVDDALSLQEALPLHRRNLELLMIAEPARVDALALRVHHDNLRRARLRSRRIARTHEMARVLPRVRCTVRGIWGGEDATIHPDIDAIRELFLGLGRAATFDVLPGVGHWAAYEAPARFNELLLRRLEG